MARGSLPAQTPQVPPDTFVSFDLLYRFVSEISGDLGYVEGISKSVDTLVASSTVLVNDPQLRFLLPAYRKVRFQAILFATGNLDYRHYGPAGASRVMISRRTHDAGGIAAALDAAFSAADIATPGLCVVYLDGIVHNGATAGPVGISHAQTASNVTPSGLYAGSVLRHSPVA